MNMKWRSEMAARRTLGPAESTVNRFQWRNNRGLSALPSHGHSPIGSRVGWGGRSIRILAAGRSVVVLGGACELVEEEEHRPSRVEILGDDVGQLGGMDFPV